MSRQESYRKPDGQGQPTEGQSAEPKTYRLGETIFPFRSGIRDVGEDEATWANPTYLSRDDFPIEGIGTARVELTESLTTETIFPSKVISRKNGEYILSEPPYEIAVVLRYDDPDTTDPHFECHVSIGDLQLYAQNTSYSNPEIREDNAGFSEWRADSEEGKVTIHVVLDGDYEQAENQVLQDFSIRFERPQAPQS